jgi:hypothetical protein
MRGVLVIIVIATLILGTGVLVALGPLWIIVLIAVAIGWVITSLPEKK